MLELISDSPGHSGIVAVGWVPRDEEVPCRVPRATCTQGRDDGLGQSSDANRSVPKAIYIMP